MINRRYYCLIFVIVLKSGIVIYAQEWTEKDSFWLQRVLNGQEKLQLNDETRKAIESGTLIRNPDVLKQMKISPLELLVIKILEGSTLPDNNPKSLSDVPPGVFKLYDFAQKDSLPDVRQATTFNAAIMAELKMLDAATYRKATVNDPFTIRPGGAGVSFEDILRTIFWPIHRAKKRNAKHANAWKSYNEGY